jgi:hypothetical protein
MGLLDFDFFREIFRVEILEIFRQKISHPTDLNLKSYSIYYIPIHRYR